MFRVEVYCIIEAEGSSRILKPWLWRRVVGPAAHAKAGFIPLQSGTKNLASGHSRVTIFLIVTVRLRIELLRYLLHHSFQLITYMSSIHRLMLLLVFE